MVKTGESRGMAADESGYNHTHAQQKLLRKLKLACKSSWSRRGNQKSFTDMFLEFGKACEDLSWNHCRSPPHRSETMVLLREQFAKLRKGFLLYCCNPAWMKIGRQILWNVIPIRETFKISCLMEKLHTKDVLENHFKDQSFRLVHCLSIALFLRQTSQESINLERKS